MLPAAGGCRWHGLGLISHLWFVARFAKERRLRIWRDYVPPTANLDQKDKQFVAKVSVLLLKMLLDMESRH